MFCSILPFFVYCILRVSVSRFKGNCYNVTTNMETNKLNEFKTCVKHMSLLEFAINVNQMTSTSHPTPWQQLFSISHQNLSCHSGPKPEWQDGYFCGTPNSSGACLVLTYVPSTALFVRYVCFDILVGQRVMNGCSATLCDGLINL